MECNKEEAIRAMGIAEKKMQNKDFQGARKIALKAQQLYPDLDNISQMLSVCDVHCATEHRVLGNEMDWYSVLQIEQTADEPSIKKQYRKFALLLHPDKNSLPGAEAAFKLIGEAQRALLDQGKRSLLDMRRKDFFKHAPPSQPTQSSSKNSNAGSYTNKQFTRMNPQHQQPQPQTKPEFNNSRLSFWTMCPFCSVKYQYYSEILNRSLRCQSCYQTFIAYDMNAQGVPTGTNKSQPASSRPKGFHHTASFPEGRQNTSNNTTSNVGNCGGKNSKMESFPKTGRTSEASRGLKTDEKCGNVDARVSKRHGLKSSGRGNDKRKRRQASGSSENLSDDDRFVHHSKSAKGNGSEDALLKEEMSKMSKTEDEKVAEQKEKISFERLSNGKIQSNSYSEAVNCSASNLRDGSTPEPEFYLYSDSDFSDFDKGREKDRFAVGQTWACYDPLDAMPRFYACVRKVFSPGFKLLITWLEPDPDVADEIKWVIEGLPVSCGKFVHGNTEITRDHLMFSHLVNWEEGSSSSSCYIYPRVGETWALFKNWDTKWTLNMKKKMKFEFEFVEILSNYVEGVGVLVAYLGKVKGFASLFCRMEKGGVDSLQIPSSELYRFSHRVPSFKMTGEEREDVPRESFEFDPASVLTDFEEIAVAKIFEADAGKVYHNGSCSNFLDDQVKPMAAAKRRSIHQALEAGLDPENASSVYVTKHHSGAQDSAPKSYVIPDPEFYDFDAEKSPERFQIGQIWALYSDEDGLPKYYGQIKKIDPYPDFQLHVAWLASCSLPNSLIRWHDEDMPISCGIFKLSRMGRPQIYAGTGSFSHQLRAEATDRKNEYTILPRKGEVWALYKCWSAEISCSDLRSREYDIVEVIEENDWWKKVRVLEHVDGFKSVYKAQFKEGSLVIIEIPGVELLRFSHQIPAFQLTEERGGSLRGYWELDPASLPVHLFCPN